MTHKTHEAVFSFKKLWHTTKSCTSERASFSTDILRMQNIWACNLMVFESLIIFEKTKSLVCFSLNYCCGFVKMCKKKKLLHAALFSSVFIELATFQTADLTLLFLSKTTFVIEFFWNDKKCVMPCEGRLTENVAFSRNAESGAACRRLFLILLVLLNVFFSGCAKIYNF